jgi:hypothetical protein
MSPELEAEYPFWRLILDVGLPKEDVEEWSLEDVLRANDILDMKQDYKLADRGRQLLKGVK